MVLVRSTTRLSLIVVVNCITNGMVLVFVAIHVLDVTMSVEREGKKQNVCIINLVIHSLLTFH